MLIQLEKKMAEQLPYDQEKKQQLENRKEPRKMTKSSHLAGGKNSFA